MYYSMSVVCMLAASKTVGIQVNVVCSSKKICITIVEISVSRQMPQFDVTLDTLLARNGFSVSTLVVTMKPATKKKSTK